MILFLNRVLTDSEVRLLACVNLTSVEVTDMGTYVFTEANLHKIRDARRAVPGDWKRVA